VDLPDAVLAAFETSADLVDQVGQVRYKGSMKPVSIYEAKTRLSELIQRASNGETIVLAKNGKPVARIVPLERTARRGPGGWKGQVKYAKDFDEADALFGKRTNVDDAHDRAGQLIRPRDGDEQPVELVLHAAGRVGVRQHVLPADARVARDRLNVDPSIRRVVVQGRWVVCP
jgi:prevent-host-death family protein